jgi:hypothetical protein
MNVTISEIQAATGLGERSARRWLQRLDIEAVKIVGTVHHYHANVIAEIQAGMMEGAQRRKEAIRESRRRPKAVESPTSTPPAAATDSDRESEPDSMGGVITVREAKRRAGRKVR